MLQASGKLVMFQVSGKPVAPRNIRFTLFFPTNLLSVNKQLKIIDP